MKGKRRWGRKRKRREMGFRGGGERSIYAAGGKVPLGLAGPTQGGGEPDREFLKRVE